MGANASNVPSPMAASEMALEGGVIRVTVPGVPFGNGNEYICPSCEAKQPPLRTTFLAKPPRYAHVLNDVLRCSYCKYIWSPRFEATVLRR